MLGFGRPFFGVIGGGLCLRALRAPASDRFAVVALNLAVDGTTITVAIELGSWIAR